MEYVLGIFIFYWIGCYVLFKGAPLLVYLGRYLLLAHWIALIYCGKALLWIAHFLGHYAAQGVLLTYFLIDELLRGDTGDHAEEETFAYDEEETFAYDAEEEHAHSAVGGARALFGLGASFTQAELKRAYKEAIRKAHPDLGGRVDEAQEINSARDLLMRANGWA